MLLMNMEYIRSYFIYSKQSVGAQGVLLPHKQTGWLKLPEEWQHSPSQRCDSLNSIKKENIFNSLPPAVENITKCTLGAAVGCGAAARRSPGLCLGEAGAWARAKGAFGTWEPRSGSPALPGSHRGYQCNEELFAVIGGSVDRVFQTICSRGWR